MKNIKKAIKSVPAFQRLIVNIKSALGKQKYIENSRKYWIDRYDAGGNSGPGSYDKLALFKGEILNDFVLRNQIKTVVEFGCGDGNQLSYLKFPKYIGYDVSPGALKLCEKKFKNDSSKTFKLIEDFRPENADLALSLDVIFHLIEESTFKEYMEKLFKASNKYVIIYSSNSAEYNLSTAPHVKHRKFTKWIKANRADFNLLKVIPNKYPYTGNYLDSSFADFYVFGKNNIN